MASTSEAIRERVRARLQEQRVLVEELLRMREQLAGSLFVRFGVCGKQGCVCRTGQKHGPYYVLSTRSGGKGGFAYLEQERVAEARELVRSYRAYRAGMKRLRRVNEQLVELLRRYQAATTKSGSRLMGVPAESRPQA
jgi:hypothetical protein